MRGHAYRKKDVEETDKQITGEETRQSGAQIRRSSAEKKWRGTIPIRGAESWWGCSDSDSGSALLIDSDSGSDPGSDAKYKISNTLIVE